MGKFASQIVLVLAPPLIWFSIWECDIKSAIKWRPILRIEFLCRHKTADGSCFFCSLGDIPPRHLERISSSALYGFIWRPHEWPGPASSPTGQFPGPDSWSGPGRWKKLISIFLPVAPHVICAKSFWNTNSFEWTKCNLLHQNGPKLVSTQLRISHSLSSTGAFIRR